MKYLTKIIGAAASVMCLIALGCGITHHCMNLSLSIQVLSGVCAGAAIFLLEYTFGKDKCRKEDQIGFYVFTALGILNFLNEMLCMVPLLSGSADPASGIRDAALCSSESFVMFALAYLYKQGKLHFIRWFKNLMAEKDE